MIYLLSNNSDVTLTPEKLRELSQCRGSKEATSEQPAYRVHRLDARLGTEQVDDIVRRYEAGASARSLANDNDVAPSALIRLLRERNIVVRQQIVTQELEAAMALDYENGMTMAEIETKHGLSHGAVLRALHQAGVKMRAKSPRKKLD
jgi:hypothetical protein